MKAVFDHSPSTLYDDEISSRYHFPVRYIDKVRACIGDFIVFREPRINGGSKSYFGIAQVNSVDTNPDDNGYYYAHLGNYLDFDQPVPWRINGVYLEAALRNIQPVSAIGLAIRGNSVRRLEDADFVNIWNLGFSETLDPDNARRFGPGVQEPAQLFANDFVPPPEQARRIEQTLLSRKFRDANFRRQVCTAYGDRCAVTGLKIINGGGRAEVQAAHIWSVANNGPDIVQNGIALSSTVHWLFDRHLISLTDEYKILVSHNKIPAELRSLFEKQMDRIHLPDDPRFWPHQKYIAHHREEFLAH